LCLSQWEKLNSGTKEHLTSLFFINDSTGWVYENKGVMPQTSNYGNSWTKQSLETKNKISTIAFLDSEGSELIIGSDDNENILSLVNNLNVFNKKDADGFQLHLNNVIYLFYGRAINKFIKIAFPVIQNKMICKITLVKSNEPRFIKKGGKECS